jgi:hypothetical protein
MEAGVVLDRVGRPLYWHLPEGRTWGSLPDCHLLWDILWRSRHGISGFAHSHPGRGLPAPSSEDLTTFAAIEAALGARLDWWITSETHLVLARWVGPGEHAYRTCTMTEEPAWAAPLRAVSRGSSWTEENIHDRTQRSTREHHLGGPER